MHTARLLTVSSSMHCARWISLAGEGSALPGGCLPFQGGVYLARGEVCLAGGGGGIPACTEADPPLCGQNSWHTLLKILPCAKLYLWAVINGVLEKTKYVTRSQSLRSMPTGNVAENPFWADIIILLTAGIWIHKSYIKYNPNSHRIYLKNYSGNVNYCPCLPHLIYIDIE